MQVKCLVLVSHTGSSYHPWRVDITTGHLLKPPLNVSLRAEASPFGALSLSIHRRGSQAVSFCLLKSSAWVKRGRSHSSQLYCRDESVMLETFCKAFSESANGTGWQHTRCFGLVSRRNAQSLPAGNLSSKQVWSLKPWMLPKSKFQIKYFQYSVSQSPKLVRRKEKQYHTSYFASSDGMLKFNSFRRTREKK